MTRSGAVCQVSGDRSHFPLLRSPIFEDPASSAGVFSYPSATAETTRARRSRRSGCQRPDIGSSLTLRWREMDSNYWSRHGETPPGAPCGFRARLHQLGKALIPRGTKSSNPSPSSGESANFRFRRRLRGLGGIDRLAAVPLDLFGIVKRIVDAKAQRKHAVSAADEAVWLREWGRVDILAAAQAAGYVWRWSGNRIFLTTCTSTA